MWISEVVKKVNFSDSPNYPADAHHFVYGTLLKNITRIDFLKIINQLENTNENAEYKVCVMGPRQQYLWVGVQSRVSDNVSRREMGIRIHARLFGQNLINNWVVFQKPLLFKHLN